MENMNDPTDGFHPGLRSARRDSLHELRSSRPGRVRAAVRPRARRSLILLQATLDYIAILFGGDYAFDDDVVDLDRLVAGALACIQIVLGQVDVDFIAAAEDVGAGYFSVVPARVGASRRRQKQSPSNM